MWKNPHVFFFLGAVRLAASTGYSYPQPPLQFDEVSTSPSPIYLPPPPFSDDVPQVLPTYLPPAYPPIVAPPEDEILPPLDDSVVISAPPTNQYLPAKENPLRILNMSCLDSRDGSGFFRGFFRTNSISRGVPMMEGSNECVVTPVGNEGFRIDLEGSRMVECGIRTCGARMCLVLRMATIPGLRLADDALVTLQCAPQERVVSQTKHIRLSAQNEQGRSNTRSVSVASGGLQRKFDSMVTLLRKSNGVFDQPLQQGSSVRLGDELLLRTTIRDGDGWKYGRIGSVIIRSASSQRSVVLVDEDGCRNPSFRAVCPQQPQQIAPLTVHFPFRAFLFQGAAPADDLLLSVRMSACLRSRDCQSKTCEDGRVRVTRAAVNISEVLITDWESQFQFRVLPKEVSRDRESPRWTVVLLGGLSAVLGCTVVFLMVKPVKERIYW